MAPAQSPVEIDDLVKVGVLAQADLVGEMDADTVFDSDYLTHLSITDIIKGRNHLVAVLAEIESQVLLP